VTDDGIIIVRTSRDISPIERYGQLQVAERRRWGTMAITIFEKSK
jgi:hypothetical protein